jgi:hypothetical protein
VAGQVPSFQHKGDLIVLLAVTVDGDDQSLAEIVVPEAVRAFVAGVVR